MDTPSQHQAENIKELEAKLAAMTQERDYLKGRAESWERDAQNLRNIGSPVVEGTIQHMAMELAGAKEALRFEKMNIETWQRDAEGKLQDRTKAYEQLAASQAREQQLREALELIRTDACQLSHAVSISEKALALPQDDTALHQWGGEAVAGDGRTDFR